MYHFAFNIMQTPDSFIIEIVNEWNTFCLYLVPWYKHIINLVVFFFILLLLVLFLRAKLLLPRQLQYFQISVAMIFFSP